MAERIKLSDYVIDFLADRGVRHIFFLPGGGSMHLNQALGQNSRVEGVCTLHEQAASICAETYARVAGNIGVCMVTTGPGGTNAITGLAGAWLESTPVLFISGQVKRADLKGASGVRQMGAQELDIVEIVRSLTKYAVTITEPSDIRYHLEKALALAEHGRRGPVWLDIPLDVQASLLEPATLRSFDKADLPEVSEPPTVVTQKAAEVVNLLNQSERPVLLVGNGVHGALAEKELRRLIEALKIPVLRTWIGADLLPDDHPYCFGKPGVVAARGANFTLQNSDLVLSIGARLDFPVTGYDRTQFARGAKKIVVDIDPAEIEKLGALPDVKVQADAGDFLRALLAKQDSLKIRDRSAWLQLCREWKDRYPVVLPEYWKSDGYINTYVFTSVLSSVMAAEDLIIPGCSGAGIDTFWLALQLKEGQSAIATGGLGAMGYGLPASIGGCIAGAGRRTISVDGDGGFQLNIQELATVARLHLPIKYFILNNNGYASIRASQNNYFKTRFACDPESGLKLPDICRVAEAYGLPSRRLASQTTLKEDIQAVLQAPGPMVAEVMIHPDQQIGPRVSSVVRPDGSMKSRPLEDLWPFLERSEFLGNMIVPPLSDD